MGIFDRRARQHGTTGTNMPGTTSNIDGAPGQYHHDTNGRHHNRHSNTFGRNQDHEYDHNHDHDHNHNHNHNHNRDYSGDHTYKNEKPHAKRPLFDKSSGHFNRRPSFGQWLKGTILDILTMIVLGAIGLGVYFADPAPSRSFPIIFADGQVVYPQFAYPVRKEIIPIWAAALLGALVPIFFFLVMQIRVRSFWDVNNAVLGLLYSLITAAVFQVFLKWLIGGLRPHFLDVCQPDPDRVVQGGIGYQQLMFNRDICTGDHKAVNDALESFPSGHSTAAFAGFMFLYFYLNAKLKVFSNHHPAMWKLAVTYMPVLGATLIAGTLTIDEFHNWYDCVAGAIIGTVFAISSYRMVYASVWDFRFNHIPLTRHTPFSYGAGMAGAAGFETAVFSRSAGWGYEEAFGGAPFDAAHHLRGVPGPGVLREKNDRHHHNNKGTGAGAKTGILSRLTGGGRHSQNHNSQRGANLNRDYDHNHDHNNIDHENYSRGRNPNRQSDIEYTAANKQPHSRTLDPRHSQHYDGEREHEHDRGMGGETHYDDAMHGTGLTGHNHGHGTDLGTGDSRYRPHGKSLERKAIPHTTTTTTTNTAQTPNTARYSGPSPHRDRNDRYDGYGYS